ncbi:MAG TPA: hypothetical protein VHE78_11260 [Gemmatimonadaceae bacterium]|nr:hypothetical protein [Gemmatimonadaceae bacterium]
MDSGDGTTGLPHRAKRIRIADGLTIAFAHDKVIVSPSGGAHWTMHLGTASGVLDVHRTERDRDPRHTTLFTLAHAELLAAVETAAGPVLDHVLGLLRPLRPGWMVRKRLVVVAGLIARGDEDAHLAHVTRVRRRRLEVDKELLRARTDVVPDAAELWARPPGEMYAVLERRGDQLGRVAGVAFTSHAADGRASRLKWLRLADIAASWPMIEQQFERLAAAGAPVPSAEEA